MKTIKLPNGLTALVHQNKYLKHTTLNILYGVGSANEDKHHTGIAHFLEHMMFEGTKLYPHFDEKMQEMMVENNAFTSQDYTCYYETFPSQYLQNILTIEQDRLHRLSLKRRAIEIQKNIIIEEYKETSLNQPLADVWHYLQPLCYKKNYSWPVIGKKISHIEAVDKKQLQDFYQFFYRTSNAVISIVSHLPETLLIHQVKTIFAPIGNNQIIPSTQSSNHKELKQVGSKQLKRKNIANTSFFLAFHIDDFGQPTYFMADMLSDLLTNGESSILYHLLIKEKKFCTEINSYLTDNKYANLLIIEGKLAAGIPISDVYQAMEVALEKIATRGISAKRLEGLKNKAMSYWTFNHYNPSRLAQNMGVFYYALGVENVIDYTFDIINSISLVQFNRFLQKGFSLDNASKLEYHIA